MYIEGTGSVEGGRIVFGIRLWFFNIPLRFLPLSE